jgi:hypothetical protein
LSFSDYEFDSDAMNKAFADNYISDFDVSSSGLRLRFHFKVNDKWSFDQVNYEKDNGNDPTGLEKFGYPSKDFTEVQDNWAYSFNIRVVKRMNNQPSYLNFSSQGTSQ